MLVKGDPEWILAVTYGYPVEDGHGCQVRQHCRRQLNHITELKRRVIIKQIVDWKITSWKINPISGKILQPFFQK